MKTIPDNSVGAVVTDPPYGLGRTPNIIDVLKDWLGKGYHEVNGGGFMGQKWDSFVPQRSTWKEIYRVLKPGGHLLSFGGTRTYDWIVLGLRLAGFEIRDTIMWIYGSGFPKSNNISHSIDKKACREKLENKLGRRPTKEEFKEAWKNFREITGNYQLPDVADGLRKKGWECSNTTEVGIFGVSGQQNITGPVTPEAKKWDGWGTALKPACEPIVVARKPLSEKTVAENVLKWGTGGINIDEGRVEYKKNDWEARNQRAGINAKNINYGKHGKRFLQQMDSKYSLTPRGRYPANVIHDDSEEVVALFPNTGTSYRPNLRRGKIVSKIYMNGLVRDGYPTAIGVNDKGSAARYFKSCPPNKEEKRGRFPANIILDEEAGRLLEGQSGMLKSGGANGKRKNGPYSNSRTWKVSNTKGADIKNGLPPSQGGASRFFYCAKASKSERNRGLDGCNIHSTVKPIALMKYLVKLVTPPKGIVLDPFAGSGSTLIACKELGFNYIGIDNIPEYCEIARRRIKAIPESLF